ncbi:MAG: hypothetical protein HQL58_02810 [Magnetococcales bacterium]|nr:hypothetical protein [Magnetococcales bacterium]
MTAAPGRFTISIDVELAWGRCDHPQQPHDQVALSRERMIVARLTQLMATYRIRATWAIVGHLLLPQPATRRADGLAHPDMERPLLHHESRDWFDHLPVDYHPFWYGRDLVAMIQQTVPEQEIGSHSFCHLPYHEQQTRTAAIDADLARMRYWHEQAGLPHVSFIFPRNVVGFRSRLYHAGVRVYRGHTKRWSDRLPWRPMRRLAHWLTFLVAWPPPLVDVCHESDSGLMNVPDSLLLFSRQGIRRLVPSDNLWRMARSGLDRAARSGRIFHLWFHPSNFAVDSDRQLAVLERILRHACALRDEGRLDIVTMGDYCGTEDPLSGH